MQQPGFRECFLDPLGGGLNKFSDNHRRPRSHRRAAVRNNGRVWLRDGDALIRKPKRFGSNLAEYGVGSLTKFRAGHQHAHGSICVRLGADEGIQIPFAGTRETCAVQKSRDSNSFSVRPSFIFVRKTLFLRDIVGKFQSPFEQTIQINIFLDGLFRCGRLAGLQKISAADFDGRNPYDLSDAVHVAFHSEKALRRAESAEGSVRRRIGGNRLRANAHIGPVIRTTGMDSAARKDDRRERRVRSTIDGELDFAAENSSVFTDGGTVARARRMALRRGGHVFHTVVDNFHGASGFHRQQRGVARDH